MTPLVLKTMSLLGRGIAFMVAAWLVIPIIVSGTFIAYRER